MAIQRLSSAIKFIIIFIYYRCTHAHLLLCSSTLTVPMHEYQSVGRPDVTRQLRSPTVSYHWPSRQLCVAIQRGRTTTLTVIFKTSIISDRARERLLAFNCLSSPLLKSNYRQLTKRPPQALVSAGNMISLLKSLKLNSTKL